MSTDRDPTAPLAARVDVLIAERDGLRLRLSEALARVLKLEAGLARYGQHRPPCESWWEIFPKHLCTCGLAVLAGGGEG